MPTSSKKMTGPDLSAVIWGLIKAGVNFVLVGGLAAGRTIKDNTMMHSRTAEQSLLLYSF